MSDLKPETGLVRQTPRSFSLVPGSLGEAREMAEMIARSDFAPKDYKGKPENVIIAVQMGADLGLKPMQALQNIAVINGRPSIYGDAALALVMPALERFFETFEGEGDALTAVCIAKRKGWPDETKRTFSVKDAKAAGLWTKQGPWTTYPKRMLQFRARGFTLRDVAADLLLGLVLAEEAEDYPNAIAGTVVASEIVEPAKDPMERIPEGLRDNILKAFETLNLPQGLRLAKINECMGVETASAEENAQTLLNWCRDEYAKRKTGQPAKREGNSNAKPRTATSPTPPLAERQSTETSQPSKPNGADSDSRPAGAEMLAGSSLPADSKELPASEIPFAGQKAAESELF